MWRCENDIQMVIHSFISLSYTYIATADEQGSYRDFLVIRYVESRAIYMPTDFFTFTDVIITYHHAICGLK